MKNRKNQVARSLQRKKALIARAKERAKKNNALKTVRKALEKKKLDKEKQMEDRIKQIQAARRAAEEAEELTS